MFLEPVLRFNVLALWTVSVPTGTIKDMELGTSLALIDGLPKLPGFASGNGLYNFAVILGHLRVVLNIFRAVGS